MPKVQHTFIGKMCFLIQTQGKVPHTSGCINKHASQNDTFSQICVKSLWNILLLQYIVEKKEVVTDATLTPNQDY